MAKGFELFLLNRDIFGQPISVLYQGSDVFRTRLGAFLSILTYILVLMNGTFLVQDYFGTERQSETQQTRLQDLYSAGPYRLDENNFNLTVVWSKLIPREAIRPRFSKKRRVFNQTSSLIEDQFEEIPLEDCSELVFEEFTDYWKERQIDYSDSKDVA